MVNCTWYTSVYKLFEIFWDMSHGKKWTGNKTLMVSILAVLILSSQIFHLYKPQNLQDNKKILNGEENSELLALKHLKIVSK